MPDVIHDLMVAFGLRTQRDVARLFEVRPTTVSTWKSRGLPAAQRLKALRLAKERRVALPRSVAGGAVHSPIAAGSKEAQSHVDERSPVRACHLTIGPNGRLELPAALLEAAGLTVGDVVIAEIEDGDMRLRPLDRAIAEVQAFVRSLVPDDVSLVDELIAERRREAERE